MKKFKIYDLYEGKETIGYADTISEMKKIGKEYYNDTDGECALVYAKLDENIQKYKFSERKNLSI